MPRPLLPLPLGEGWGEGLGVAPPVEHDPMEELYELRTYIATGKYHEALLLLDEMEGMSRDDKINSI